MRMREKNLKLYELLGNYEYHICISFCVFRVYELTLKKIICKFFAIY